MHRLSTFRDPPQCAALLPHCDYPRRARAERLIAHLHGQGARVLAEFLDELARRYGIADDVRWRLEDWADRLDARMIAVVGADKFPAAPPRRVT